MNIALSTISTPQPNNIPTSTQTVVDRDNNSVNGIIYVIENAVVEL